MTEISSLGETKVDLSAPLAFILQENGFDLSRVDPWLKNESAFPFQSTKTITVKPVFFRFKKGASLAGTRQAMFQLSMHAPTDLREILAVGRLIEQSKFTYTVYAPETTKAPENFLQIQREADWNGFGLTIRTFVATDEPLSSLQMIGFQNV